MKFVLWFYLHSLFPIVLLQVKRNKTSAAFKFLSFPRVDRNWWFFNLIFLNLSGFKNNQMIIFGLVFEKIRLICNIDLIFSSGKWLAGPSWSWITIHAYNNLKIVKPI